MYWKLKPMHFQPTGQLFSLLLFTGIKNIIISLTLILGISFDFYPPMNCSIKKSDLVLIFKRICE